MFLSDHWNRFTSRQLSPPSSSQSLQEGSDFFSAQHLNLLTALSILNSLLYFLSLLLCWTIPLYFMGHPSLAFLRLSSPYCSHYLRNFNHRFDHHYHLPKDGSQIVISIPDLFPELQDWTSNCLLDVSTLTSHKYFKQKLPQMELIIYCPKPFLLSFPPCGIAPIIQPHSATQTQTPGTP